MSENRIDIEKIMGEIRQNIEDRGYTQEMLKFDEIDTQSYDQDSLELTEDYSQERLIREIDQARDTCRLAPVEYTDNKFKYFVKRVLRKADSVIRFQKHQTNFNLNTAKSLNQIEKYILLNDETPMRGAVQESPMEKQMRFYKNTEELIERLENRIALLETEVDELRKQLGEK